MRGPRHLERNAYQDTAFCSQRSGPDIVSFHEHGTGCDRLGHHRGDPALSFNQIAKRVNLSAPSVAARIRRLEETGVIEGYHAQISPAAVGWPVAAFVQLHCHPGRCLLKTSAAENFPEIVEIHRLSGSSCTMVKVRTASMEHLSSLLERIGEHADANSHIVLETPLEHQALKIPPPPPAPTRHPGWNP